jgi:hypothetical protein
MSELRWRNERWVPRRSFSPSAQSRPLDEIQPRAAGRVSCSSRPVLLEQPDKHGRRGIDHLAGAAARVFGTRTAATDDLSTRQSSVEWSTELSAGEMGEEYAL